MDELPKDLTFKPGELPSEPTVKQTNAKLVVKFMGWLKKQPKLYGQINRANNRSIWSSWRADSHQDQTGRLVDVKARPIPPDGTSHH